MREALIRKDFHRSQGTGPIAFGTIHRPVALVPDLVDREALLVQDPLFALDIPSAADGTSNVLSPIFLLQYADDYVTLGTGGGHWLTENGTTRMNYLPLERSRGAA